MLSNVPQFIDVEDKIVGPLTAKQLGWLALGGVAALVAWNFLDTSAFAMACVIIGAIVGALAFVRPYGQPLITVIFSGITFIFRPKIYLWRRLAEQIARKKTESLAAIKKAPAPDKLNAEKVKEIAELLDEPEKKIIR